MRNPVKSSRPYPVKACGWLLEFLLGQLYRLGFMLRWIIRSQDDRIRRNSQNLSATTGQYHFSFLFNFILSFSDWPFGFSSYFAVIFVNILSIVYLLTLFGLFPINIFIFYLLIPFESFFNVATIHSSYF